ncbi:hypothetical protein GQX73_g1776 [Xylaria multiplex]|uniref:Serum paraoxonase/arylesterase n=1 Tax=Xylaria multiplex TaxID=323545 RepID=A0A7C8MX83_9PEZI|nr:hypothetical protein GQX73_g1776 [Xylaria multiplex]
MIAFAAYTLIPEITRSLAIIGLLRTPTQTLKQGDFVIIEDTVNCEDIHYHSPSRTLYTACEDTIDTRMGWFPPLEIFHNASTGANSTGSIHDMTSRRLQFENFSGTFVTHGIDVLSDPDRPEEAVYIFAVNHVPDDNFVRLQRHSGYTHSSFYASNKSASRIELFHHVVGSPTLRHVRSIQHHLIRTPNDIFALSPQSFYVTNDHYYKEGWMRRFELLYRGAKWSDTIYVHFDESIRSTRDGVQAKPALSGIHTNNGLGHGKLGQILVSSSASGLLNIGEVPDDPRQGGINLVDFVEVDSFVDNPSWFEDSFASVSHNASGLIIPGMSKMTDVPRFLKGTSRGLAGRVWHAIPASQHGRSQKHKWDVRLLLEDDGTLVNAISSAVMVAIDPGLESGKRKAWLFVSGFLARNIIATKVDI